jgi:hypothetical protein
LISEILRKPGTQHNSQMFETIYTDKSIAVSLAPTKHKKSKYFTETIWQFLRKIAQLMMVHARLLDIYIYHYLLHAHNEFNLLHLLELVTAGCTIATPYDKPKVRNFRAFGCP